MVHDLFFKFIHYQGPVDRRMDIYGLYSLVVSPEDFLRESGEAFAHADASWKTAKNEGKNVDVEIKSFLEAGIVHIDALELCGHHREAFMTVVSVLISIDMVHADTVGLGEQYLNVNVRLVEGAARLRYSLESDKFARPHAVEILRHSAALLVMALNETNVAVAPKIMEMGRGCRGIMTQESSRQELLVDIFARLHAIES